MPYRPFPFDPRTMALPTIVPDCHLDRTVIPCLPSYDSLDIFYDEMVHSLSLFCKDGFQKQYRQALGRAPSRVVFFPRILTQGRLRCTQHTILCTALQVLFPARTRKGLPPKEFANSSHNTGSPRKPGRMLHAIGARPESLTPSIHPKLGVKSRHQGLHRCALQRIFRPFLEDGHSD